MKFTVFGGRGYVGRHILRHLGSAGVEVEAPLRDDSSVFERPLGHVLYCIGLTADFRFRPFDTVEAHVTLLAQLLERAAFDSLLYLSSTRLYASGSLAHSNATIHVNPHDPDALYNCSKLLGEALCLRDTRPVRVARLSNVYGGEEASPSFIEMILRDARERGEIVLQSAENSRKDFVHIDDVAPILVRIATAGQRRLYNVASGTNTSFGEIVSLIAAATRSRVRVQSRAPTLSAPQIDVADLRDEFGWEPRAMDQGLRELLSVRGYEATESER